MGIKRAGNVREVGKGRGGKHQSQSGANWEK